MIGLDLQQRKPLKWVRLTGIRPATKGRSTVFTSISGPELLMILILGLLLFGPRKLPEIGRKVGKAFSEFRRATTDFKMNLEREVESTELTELKEVAQEVDQTVREAKGVVERQLRFEPEASGPDDDSDKSQS